MTMDIRFFLPITMAALVACTQNTSSVPEVALQGIERTVEEVAVAGAPVTTADLSIEGMSCAMMCGGSIKKALAQLPGVVSTEIEFIEGDERDHAVVTYDPAQVDDAQMVEAIQKLHDGQYKVLAVKITRQVQGKTAGGTETQESEETKPVSVIDPAAMVVPGILSLLSYVLRL